MLRRIQRVDAEGAEALLGTGSAKEMTKTRSGRGMDRVIARTDFGSRERKCLGVLHSHLDFLTCCCASETAEVAVKLS